MSCRAVPRAPPCSLNLLDFAGRTRGGTGLWAVGLLRLHAETGAARRRTQPATRDQGTGAPTILSHRGEQKGPRGGWGREMFAATFIHGLVALCRPQGQQATGREAPWRRRRQWGGSGHVFCPFSVWPEGSWERSRLHMTLMAARAVATVQGTNVGRMRRARGHMAYSVW